MPALAAPGRCHEQCASHDHRLQPQRSTGCPADKPPACAAATRPKEGAVFDPLPRVT